MIANSKPRRKRTTGSSETAPSPEKVRAMAAEIRKTWSPRERRRRALLARSAVLRQLIGSGW